jgi:hypothetical protein
MAPVKAKAAHKAMVWTNAIRDIGLIGSTSGWWAAESVKYNVAD